MASLDRVIENPFTGKRLTFVVTAQESNGALVKVKSELPAGSPGTPMHIHLNSMESFEVLEGALDICIGGKHHHRILKPGGKVDVSPKTPHRWWNSSHSRTVFMAEFTPAKNSEAALRMAYGLMRDGRTNQRGVPTNIWELALAFELSDSFFPGPPIFLQKAISRTLAGIAKRIGYDPEFSQYTKS